MNVMNMCASVALPDAVGMPMPVPAQAVPNTQPDTAAVPATAAFGEAWLQLLAGGDMIDPAMADAAAPAAETPAVTDEDSSTETRDAQADTGGAALLALLMPAIQAALPMVMAPVAEDTAADDAATPATPRGLPAAGLSSLPAASAVSQQVQALRDAAAPASVTTGAPGSVAPAETAPVATESFVMPASSTGEQAKPEQKPAVTTTTTTVAAASGDASTLVAAPAQPAARGSEGVLKLPNGEPTQWRQPLLQALGDRIQLQRSGASDSAVIRLDPPQMGRIEISIRHEAGAITVNLSATHNEVLRQLQGIGETLRHDLSQRHQGGEVSVQVSESAASRGMARDGGNDGRRQAQEQAEAGPGRALAEAESGHEKNHNLAGFRLASEQE
ncbi:MAG TPA: flagellar hook-length control protein FliK [Rhodocyclaceae bacterium]|nr:flagellar hook-length control protein FliK [Rhodocyclaceae bacterium]